MNTEYYQDELAGSSGNRIMVGARQVGKTSTIVHDVVARYRDEQTVLVVAPRQEMVFQIQDMVQAEVDGHNAVTKRYIESLEHDGFISFMSATSVDFNTDKIQYYDAICIDEANYVDQELCFNIQHEFDGDVLLTITPAAKPHIVDMWAKHSPYWQTTQVSASDAPHIDGYSIRDRQALLSTEQQARELDAEITSV